MTNDTPPRPLVILGAGGHAVSVANVAISAGFEIYRFVDKSKKGQSLLGIGIIGSLSELSTTDQFSYCIAIGDNAVRELVYRQISSEFGSIHFPKLVHSTATVSSFTTIDEGVVVMPGAVIGPNSSVEKFCLINTRASIDHDCTMQEFSSLAPAAATGGSVSIGRRSAVSIGATIKHGISIGDDCVIGANSYLNRNLPSLKVAYGSPAREIRSRNPGEPYLK